MNLSRKDFLTSVMTGGPIYLLSDKSNADEIKNNKVNSFVCKLDGYDIIPTNIEIEENTFNNKVSISFLPCNMKVPKWYWVEANRDDEPWVDYSMDVLKVIPKKSMFMNTYSMIYIDFLNKTHIESINTLKLRHQFDNRMVIFIYYYEKENKNIIKSLNEFKDYYKIA